MFLDITPGKKSVKQATTKASKRRRQRKIQIAPSLCSFFNWNTFKPRSEFWGQVWLIHGDNLQRSVVGNTQLRLMHSSVRTALLTCVLTSLCLFLPMCTLSYRQFTCMSLVQSPGLATGTLIWKTRLWTCLWTHPSPQTKRTQTLGAFLSRSMLCILPRCRCAFISLSEHDFWVFEAICIASWGPRRTKEAFTGGTETTMHWPRAIGTGWVPAT